MPPASPATSATVTVAPVPLLLGPREAHQYLGISRSAYYRLISAGELPAPVEVPGAGPHWRRADLDKWVARLGRRRRRRPAAKT